MDRSDHGRRTSRRTTSLIVSAALALGAFAVLLPAAATTNPLCKVTNLASLAVYGGSGTNLQTAIDAANPGVTLQIQGVCVGNFTIAQDINLKGKTSDAYPKKARLDGNALGTVVTVNAGAVSLRNLKITNGDAPLSTNDVGGGVYNLGTLSLGGSTVVTGNTSGNEAAGIYNAGTLTMGDGSAVSGNTAARAGGGIYSIGPVTMNGRAKVANNTPDGIYAYIDSSVIMNGRASVRANKGTGILFQGTEFTMNDASVVAGNTSAGAGGVIVFSTYALTMNDSSAITGNMSTGDGGGAVIFGSLTMNDQSSIRGNVADSDHDTNGRGGGIFGNVSTGTSLTGVTDGVNVVSNTPDNIFLLP